jgi:hypothetical protein
MKLRTAAFPTQQLPLHSSFPASHKQRKQTGLKAHTSIGPVMVVILMLIILLGCCLEDVDPIFSF